MAVTKKVIDLVSHGNTPSYFNITEAVREAIAESGIGNGICAVISPHTTCSVFYEEYVHDFNEAGDEFLQEDLNGVLGKIIPDQTEQNVFRYPGETHYAAVASWPDAEAYLPGGDRTALWNGDAHLKATVLGSSQIFDVTDGKLGTGTTGHIYFVDFDRTRSRTRHCRITVMGE